MRVTCRSLSRKRSTSQTLIFSRRRNNRESRRFRESSSALSIWFGECSEKAGKICRLHEPVECSFRPHVPNQERDDLEVFCAGMLRDTDQKNQPYPRVTEQNRFFAGRKN